MYQPSSGALSEWGDCNCNESATIHYVTIRVYMLKWDTYKKVEMRYIKKSWNEAEFEDLNTWVFSSNQLLKKI